MGKEQRNAANQHDRLLQQYAGVAAALNINAEDWEGIRATELRTAFELFRKAAAQGGGLYSTSCFSLRIARERLVPTPAPAIQASGPLVSKICFHIRLVVHVPLQRGHTLAQFDVGLCLARGLGVEVNLSEAFGWFRKAAEKECAYAQNRLALHHHEGLGVDVDDTLAGVWSDRALANFTAEDEVANPDYMKLAKELGANIITEVKARVEQHARLLRRGHVDTAALRREITRRCRVCAALDTRFKCSACRDARYCSIQCQRWGGWLLLVIVSFRWHNLVFSSSSTYASSSRDIRIASVAFTNISFVATTQREDWIKAHKASYPRTFE
jgi:hypothetical protein